MTPGRTESLSGDGRRRVGALDLLRGLAISMVVVSHVAGSYLPGVGVDLGVNGLGTAGVLLFFLLSGYLIQGNLERQSLAVFLSRRMFKILPAFWLNILAILCLDWLGWKQEGFATASYVASALMVSDVLMVPAVGGVFWTLLIEVRFYLFIALYHRLLGERGMPFVVLGLIALNGLSWLLRGHGSGLIVFFPVFYVGVALHRAERSGWSRNATGFAVGVMAALIGSLTAFADPHFAGAGLLLFLMVVLFVAVLRAEMRNPVLEFLGRTSYSNYLFHSLVALVVERLIGWDGTALGEAGLMGATFALSIALAALLHHCVEEPMVRLGKGLERRWGAGWTARPAPLWGGAGS